MNVQEVEKKIVEIVLTLKKPEKIVLFGSRATGVFTERSDYDIAIFDKNMTGKELNNIKFMIDEEIPVAAKFDVLNFYSITKESLRENIVREGRVLYES